MAVLAASLFLLTVLIRAPASWALKLAPPGVDCSLPSGSLWHGSCARLRAAGVELQEVGWTAHAWPLLRGHFDVEVSSADARAPGRVRLSIGLGGHLELRDLQAQLPVGTEFLPLFPTTWKGKLRLDLRQVEFEQHRLQALIGTVTALDLEQRSPPIAFGSYELNFGPVKPGDDAIVGNLRDVGGPLAVTGTLRLRNGSEYELNGRVAARPTASAELTKTVEFLGASDAQGRREFSLTGTL
ncbi:MAG TPA: type II secretion system protein N [Steroidobacteraceae bacterium]|nr:type II secretion system protein N [Steroidobacteraceae bacterium]